MLKAIAGFVVVFTLFFSNTAMAVHWLVEQEIVRVTQSETGQVVVNTGGDDYWTAAGDSNTKSILVTLLAAQAMKAKVSLKFNGADLIAVTVLSN